MTVWTLDGYHLDWIECRATVMNTPKCRECSQPTHDPDLAISSEGGLIHVSCWQQLSSQNLIRESKTLLQQSRARLDWVPQNDKDAHGWPICPTCRKALGLGESAVRQDGYMVHLNCYRPTLSP